MGQSRIHARLAAGCLIALGFVSAAPAQSVTPQQMLAYRPKQEVQVTTPATEGEIAACKVEVVKGANNTSAWLLRDGRGQPLRRFADTTGSRKADTYSFYFEGNEVYREIDSNGDTKIDQYRWFGPAGSRWGVDLNQDGIIDGWKQISPEEVSQEVLRAVATKNINRLQALLISAEEIKAMDLPAAEATRIAESVAKIRTKFQETIGKASINETTRWVHLETAAPQCIAADTIGGKFDLIRYQSGTILHETNGKHDWLQTGEMIQIGRAWRIIGAPMPGPAAPQIAMQNGNNVDEAIKPLVEELGALDKNAPKIGSPEETVRHNLARAAIIRKIAVSVKGDEHENWVKQIADCYSTAAQNAGKDTTPYLKLVEMRDQYAKLKPGSPLAGYIAFREMSVDYSAKIAGVKGGNLGKVQDDWGDKLKGFVETYPTAEDVPDAMIQLGMVNEFSNKEGIAKNWYEMLVTKHPKSPLAAKAQGAIRRLNSDGQTFMLTAPELTTKQPFDIGRLFEKREKVAVVYYWASWNQQSAADFFKLATLTKQFTGLEIVSVNLDDNPAAAAAFLGRTPTPGIHLGMQPGGLDGTLANQYGIMVLPSMFLVGRDGKVVSHNVQMSGLEDEVKKVMDK